VSTSDSRLVAPDVARALALFGVIAMNYHGSLNPGSSSDGFFDRLFDTSTGVLSTRFAALFVAMAGVGVSLMASKSRASLDRAGLRQVRIRLARRGLFLFAVGYALNHAWGGTIIFYYGAYLIIASLIVDLPDSTLVSIGAGAIAAAAGIKGWVDSRPLGAGRVEWLDPPDITSVPDLIGRIFTGYTHPVLPWISFFIVGMIIGRHWSEFQRHARSIMLMAIGFTAITYLVVHFASTAGALEDPWTRAVFDTEPFGRGLGYSITTIGIVVAVFATMCRLVERFEGSRIVAFAQRAGQMTLSAYLLHVLAYYVLFRWWSIVDSRGLGTALAVAAILWITLVIGASMWRDRCGPGPAERIYRLVGG
jgi:uncharacterized protein